MDIQETAGCLFDAARRAITDLENSLIVALDNAVGEGRLTLKRENITAELQWPYHGWYAAAKATEELPLRLFIEAALPPHETTSPSTTSSAPDKEPEDWTGL